MVPKLAKKTNRKNSLLLMLGSAVLFFALTE